MEFVRPSILPESKVNELTGKCLMVGHPSLGPTASEVMQLLGHHDLVANSFREVLGCCRSRFETIKETHPEIHLDSDIALIDKVTG